MRSSLCQAGPTDPLARVPVTAALRFVNKQNRRNPAERAAQCNKHREMFGSRGRFKTKPSPKKTPQTRPPINLPLGQTLVCLAPLKTLSLVNGSPGHPSAPDPAIHTQLSTISSLCIHRGLNSGSWVLGSERQAELEGKPGCQIRRRRVQETK